MTRPSRHALAITLGSLAAALALWSPAFQSLDATGFGDWQQFLHFWESGYVAITRYGEWPLWDPYHCGGITIFGNPQSQHLSPFFALALLFGPTIGQKLFLVLHAWAGFSGMYRLSRSEGLQLPGALLATLAWAASGFFVSHGSGGHSAFLPFYLAPWVLLTWRAAVRDPRYVAPLSLLLLLVLLEGGVYPFPYLLLLLAFDAVVQLVLRQNVRGVLVAAALSAPVVPLVGAIRLLPILDELSRHPRTMPSHDGVSLPEILEMLTARSHGWHYGSHQFVWPEYVTYVGWGIVSLGTLGLLASLAPHTPIIARRIAVGLCVFLALTMGDHGEWSLWPLVHRLPIYDSLRVPSRFAVFFTLYLALLAGAALQLLTLALARVSRASGKLSVVLTGAVPLLLIAGIASDLFIVHYPTLNRWHDPPVTTDRVSPRFYNSPLPYGRWYASFPRMNLGSLGCYEAMNFQVVPGMWTGDKPQARVTRGHGKVSSFRRSTRHVFLRVVMSDQGRVLLNQHMAPGWTSNLGTAVDDAGRLAIDLPAGTHDLDVVYLPPTLIPSTALSALGLLLAFLVWRFGARFAAKPAQLTPVEIA